MAKITRSPGYIAIKGLPFIAGGGYSGKTEELDNAVLRCADFLAQTFPQDDVEIRFNSNRESGGAFIEYPDGHIGMGAGLWRHRSPEWEAQHKHLQEDFREWMKQADMLPLVLRYTLNLSAAMLQDSTLATENRGTYLWETFATFEEARVRLLDIVRKEVLCDNVSS